MSELKFKMPNIEFHAVFDDEKVRKVDRELSLVTKAKKQASENLPPPDAKELSPDEDLIILRYKEVIEGVRWAAYEQIEKIKTFTTKVIGLLYGGVDLEKYELEYRKEVSDIVGNRKNDVYEAKKELDVAEPKYKHIIDDYDIKRPPIYRDTSKTLQILVILIFAESVLNSFLYFDAHPSGFLGGVMIAFLVSLSNVLISFFVLGFLCIRAMINPESINRAFISFGIFLSGLAIILINLFASHYRDALSDCRTSLDPYSCASSAVDNTIPIFIDNPLGIDSFTAALLFFIGIGLAVYATYEGVMFKEVIPGYKDIYDRYQDAKSKYKNVISGLRNALFKAGSSCHEKIQQDIDLLQECLSGLVRSISDHKEIIKRYENFEKYTQDACNESLKRYREVNMSIRKKEAPVTFNEYPDIRPGANFPPPDHYDEEIEKLRLMLQEKKAERNKYQDKVQSMIDSTIDNIESIVHDIEKQKA